MTTTITPGASWDGTANSGGTPPTASGTVRGTGWDKTPAAAFDEPPLLVKTADFYLTIGCEHGDDSWIESVDVWLEGNTATLSVASVNPTTGGRGFVVQVVVPAGVDGFATLVAIIKPVNGYERAISLSLLLNGGGTITRDVFYVDPVLGTDSGPGTGRGASAWQTIAYATTNCTDGAVIKLAAGTHIDEAGSVAFNFDNTRPITVMPDDGLTKADVTIAKSSRTSNSGNWRWFALMIEFRNVTVALDTIVLMYGRDNGHYYFTQDCDLIDGNGPAGPAAGYYDPTESGQMLVRDNEGQRAYLLESTVTNYITTGFWLYRNSVATYSGDAVFWQTSKSNGSSIWNYAATQASQMESRASVETSLSIKNTSYDSGTDRTTITYSGSPTLKTIAAGASTTYCRFLTGALAGLPDSNGFPVYSQDSTTTVVTGDASAAVNGDTCRVFYIFHADAFQFNTLASSSENFENFFIQRYKNVGLAVQPLFLQPDHIAGSGTISTSGAALTCSGSHGLQTNDFVELTSGAQSGEIRRVLTVDSGTTATLESAFSADQSGTSWFQVKSVTNVGIQDSILDHTAGGDALTQLQDAQVHLVIRRTTHIGCGFFIQNTSHSGRSGVVVTDSIFRSMTSAAAFPTDGITIDNCVFEDATLRGTNGIAGAGNDTTVDPATFAPVVGSAALNALAGARVFLPVDYAGATIPTDGSAAIGALQPPPAPPPPEAPATISAIAASATSVRWSWAPSVGATSYSLEWSTASDFTGSTTVTGITHTSFTVNGLTPSTTYYGRVSAVSGAGTSSATSSANATTPSISAPHDPRGHGHQTGGHDRRIR